MGIGFDDLKKGAEDVVKAPGKIVQNVVQGVADTVAGGGAGTAGAAAVAGSVLGGAAPALGKALGAAIPQQREPVSRADAYNKRIADLQATPPDYEKLTVLWRKYIHDRLLPDRRQMYAKLNLSDSQLNEMVGIDIETYRKTLSQEEFKAQLDEIHHATVEVAIHQLEFERDHPDEAGNPAPPPQKEKQWRFENALFHWIIEHIASNIEGVSRESGDGAKALRATLGISVKDIQERGILGGDNSYLRQILPAWDNKEGVLGGENSFFHKNLGLSW